MPVDDISPLETAIGIINNKAEYPLQSRMSAILYLVEKYEDESRPFLKQLLQDTDEDAELRSAVALALGRIGGKEVFPLLSEELHRTDNQILRNYILQAFGILGDTDAIPLLMAALKDTDNDIFYSAAESLGKIGKPALPYLIDLLLGGGADDARCIAAWQLGTLQYSEAIDALLTTIEHDSNKELIALSIWAVGEIGLSSDDVMGVLRMAKANEDPTINERAALAIKKISRHVN